MNLTSPSQVKSWCIENGFHPNKVLGQNFLIDRNALEGILDASGATVGTKVLEVGPGLGVLTEGLIQRGAIVTAVEKDPVLAKRLAESLGNPPNLTVIDGDALKFSAEGKADGFDMLVSNLPYSVGTRILLELIKRCDLMGNGERGTGNGEAVAPFAMQSMTVLVQDEVAERLAAGPGSKTRGLAGVWAQLDFDVEKVLEVNASCFWPRPKVGSSVVTLKRHADPGLTLSERETFRRITKKAFEHRRKQLGSIFKGLIESTARAEQLTLDHWIELAKGLNGHEDA